MLNSYRLFVLGILLGVLLLVTGCQKTFEPPNSVLRSAIEKQIAITNETLSSLFGSKIRNVDVIGFTDKEFTKINPFDQEIILASGNVSLKIEPYYRSSITLPFIIFLEQKDQVWSLVETAVKDNDENALDFILYELFDYHDTDKFENIDSSIDH